jgi:hypothetical protein
VKKPTALQHRGFVGLKSGKTIQITPNNVEKA